MSNVVHYYGLCLFLLLSACVSAPIAQVNEIKVFSEFEQTDEFGGKYVRHVQPGETLHTIAFVAGLDVNKVAQWNDINIKTPLRVGRRIRLSAPVGFVFEENPVVKPKVTIKNKIIKNKKIAIKPKKRSNPVDVSMKKTINQWSWPVNTGRVVGYFSNKNSHQGIDIEEIFSSPVIASADGVVVYVGNGLPGYGNLVIVQHANDFLTAYAHNNQIFVKESESVIARQKIGSVGYNDDGKTALHFQIRKKGEPVNPLRYLPKRS